MVDHGSYSALSRLNVKTGREASYVLVDRPSFLSLVSIIPVPEPRVNPAQRCITSIFSPARMRWDLVIIFLSIWNCFYVPFIVAFLPTKELLPLVVANIFIDLLYLLDIVVYARSTYIDWDTGKEVTDPRKILRNYLSSGKLFIDVIAAIPFDLITLITEHNAGLKFMTLSKGIRLFRLSKILTFWQTKTQVKSGIKLCQLLLFFIVYLHIVACLWYQLTSSSAEYRPPALYVDRDTELLVGSTAHDYAYSLYMSVYMLTAAEIGPRTAAERVFAGCAIVLGQLFQAFMFGEIAVVLFSLNRNSEELASIYDAAGTTMVSMHLPRPLREKISKFLIMMQGSLTRHREYEEFFRVLPPSLKQEIRAFVFELSLAKNPILKSHSQISNSVLHRLGTRYCQPEENVILQGETANEFYIIAGGKCAVYVLGEQRVQNLVKFMCEGAHFGEIALVFPTSRTATVRAVNYPTLAVLTRDDFVSLCRRYPGFETSMKTSALRYKDVWKNFLLATLRRCPCLTHVSDKILSEVIYMIPQRMYEAGSLICKDGEISREVVFVIEGEVEIYTVVNDSCLKIVPETQLYNAENPILGRRIRTLTTSYGFALGQKIARYTSRLTLELLGPGSVICPYATLLNEKVRFNAKARKATIVMNLSQDSISSLVAKVREIREFAEDFRSDLRSKSLKRAQLLAGDYEKRISEKMKRSLWESRMKLKRCILSKLLEKRSLRKNKYVDVWGMTNKLKAIMEAERKGDYWMMEKIRRGVAPESQYLIDAYNLLDISEVENPLLTQFADETVKLSHSILQTHTSISGLSLAYQSLRMYRSAAKSYLSEVKEIVRLIARLNSAKRERPSG